MRVNIKNKRIYIEETAIVVLFVCILSKTAREYLENYYLCFLFIAFHEFCHVLIASLFGLNIKALYIKISGLNVNIEKNFSGKKAILVYLAGPIANILLAILFRYVNIVFEINLALAIINLIPIYPLDGYSIVKEILECNIEKRRSKNIIKFVTDLTDFLFTILSIVIAICYHNISMIIMLVYIKSMRLNPLKTL